MRPDFVSRGPVVGEEKIAAFEVKCGFPLPPDYRQFLLEQNGGDRPVEREPEDDDEGGTETIQFFSLAMASTIETPRDEVAADPERWMDQWLILMRDLEERMEGARGYGHRSYPPELLPIAELSIGMLLLRLKGRGTGAVIQCYDPDGYEPGHVSKVAKSFAEFLRDIDDYSW